MITRKQIYSYVRDMCEKDNAYLLKDKKLFESHIDYYVDNDLIAICVVDEKITAMGFARPVATAEDCAISTRVDYDGTIISVDMFKADLKEDVEYLSDQMIKRFPNITHIAFQRLLKQDGRVRLFSIGRILKIKILLGKI